MPLKPSEILKQLHEKRTEFTNYNQTALQVLKLYQAGLQQVCDLEADRYESALAELPTVCGAFPLEPLTKSDRGVIRCGLNWDSREASLEWVRERLAEVATFAVDGSQIFPSKDISLLVALVQIGWYENRHTPTGDYTKDIEVAVMTPAELEVGDRRELIDRKVNMKRFQMECDRLVRYMAAHERDEQCLVFFDGSLVATFAEAFDDESRQSYVKALQALIAASQTYQVPLVGYVDTSYARDMVTLLQQLKSLPDLTSIHDAQVLNGVMKKHWGDRTPLYLCCRSGILEQYGEWQDQITFTYLKTNQNGYPARLELPRWIFEAGRLEQVMDWVRGEVIVGSGYPYVIETADQTAVLQAGDRQIFYRLLQDWAEQQQLKLRLSRKMVSKVRRR